MAAVTNGPSVGAATVKKSSGKRFELPKLDFKFGSLTDGTDIPPPLPSPVEEEPPKPVAAAKKEANKAAETKKEEGDKGKENDAKGAKEATAAKETGKQSAKPEEALSNSANNSSKIDGTPATASSPTHVLQPQTGNGQKRPAEDIPASPTLSSRPGSIRRLFSRNFLNSTYTNTEAKGSTVGLNSSAGSITRPESRSNASFMDGRKSKRSSGWFRRLRGGGATASSNGSINGDVTRTKHASMIVEEPPKSPKPQGPPPPTIPELGELKAKVDLNDEGSIGTDLFKNIK